jgi:hypothetical protein
MQPAMGQDRAGMAIARMERAMARIEAAATHPSAAPAASDSAADELRRAHHMLRSKVEGAIAELDGLIASGDQS